MKAQLALLLMLFSGTCCYDFSDYMVAFEKHYSSDEALIREGIWKENVVEIEKTNSLNLPYKLAINNFTDWTKQEISRFVNATKDTNSTVGQVKDSELRVGGPTSFDWRDSGKVSPIKNQGTCGACWAFSSTAVYESLILMGNSTTFDLSEEYVIECANRTYSDCGGGRVSDALNLMSTKGIPLQATYPYRAASSGDVTPSTAGICSTGNLVSIPSSLTSKILKNVSVANMKSMVLTAPYVALVYADAGFMTYSSGVYGCATANQNLLNHAITIIGYDDTSFIIKNSWGTTWGINGYMQLSQTSNCGLNLWIYQLIQGDTPAPSAPTNFAAIALQAIILAVLLVI